MSSCGSLLESGGSACPGNTSSKLLQLRHKGTAVHCIQRCCCQPCRLRMLLARLQRCRDVQSQFFADCASAIETEAGRLSHRCKIHRRNCVESIVKAKSLFQKLTRLSKQQTENHLEDEAVLPSYYRPHEHAVQLLIVLLRLCRSHICQLPLQVCKTQEWRRVSALTDTTSKTNTRL